MLHGSHPKLPARLWWRGLRAGLIVSAGSGAVPVPRPGNCALYAHFFVATLVQMSREQPLCEPTVSLHVLCPHDNSIPLATVPGCSNSLRSSFASFTTDQQWELGRSTQQELRATVPMVENSVLKVGLLGLPLDPPFTLTKETSVCGDGHPSFLANKHHSSGAEMASARSSASSLRLLPTRRL